MVGEKGTVFPTLFSSPPTESPVDSGDSLKGRRNPGEGRGGFVHKAMHTQDCTKSGERRCKDRGSGTHELREKHEN